MQIKSKKRKVKVWFGKKPNDEDTELSYHYEGSTPKQIAKSKAHAVEHLRNVEGVEEVYEVDFDKLTIETV